MLNQPLLIPILCVMHFDNVLRYTIILTEILQLPQADHFSTKR